MLSLLYACPPLLKFTVFGSIIVLGDIDYMRGAAAMTIKELKKGDFFTLKPITEPKESQVYIRGEYDRSEKKYSCGKFSDMCYERFFKGDKEVFTDFTF